MKHQLILNPAYVKTGDWSYESGYKMAKDLLTAKGASGGDVSNE